MQETRSLNQLTGVMQQTENELLRNWIARKIEICNGLSIGFCSEGLRFQIEDEDESQEEYQELLQAKVYDTFGVSDIHVASTLLTNCVNSIYSHSLGLKNEGKQDLLRQCFSEAISLFREFRPRDPFEAMMVSKLIIIDLTSTREFIAANSCEFIDRKTTHQNRAIKLSRLWLEIKDKLDKHRKPNQQINVQYNHIYNEGQAIIGSQLSTGGGGINKNEG